MTKSPCPHCQSDVTTRMLEEQAEQLKRQAQELRELALRDDLTRLYNRRGFYAVSDQYLLHARRSGESALLCYFDIDGLKHVNDTEGHKAGDALIRAAGDALVRTFRAPDIIARMGGDEFAVLAIGTTNAQAVLRRLAHELEDSKVRFSSGVVAFDPRTSDDIEAMLDRADTLMYAQKRERKAG